MEELKKRALAGEKLGNLGDVISAAELRRAAFTAHEFFHYPALEF